MAWPALAVGVCGCATAHPASVRLVQARVPAGFAPQAFSAVTESDFWLLGTAPCRGGRCTAIVRTHDAGQSFSRLTAPKLPVEGTVPVLELADERNGFAFVPDGKSPLYATHDGGSTWQRQSLGAVLAFAAGGGTAYAVTARHRLERAPVSSTTWTATTLPFVPDGGIVSLAVRRSKVWLLGTPTGNRQSHDRLVRSLDSGRTFTTGPGPCYADLGGELRPASASVVWAVCPTGMLAGALRSTDGGTSFSRLGTPALVNSAQLAPASSSAAVLFGNGAGSRLLRTTDGGNSWTAAKTPRRPIAVWWVGFTSSRVGYALVQTRDRAYSEDLWRTTDAGANWSQLKIS